MNEAKQLPTTTHGCDYARCTSCNADKKMHLMSQKKPVMSFNPKQKGAQL